MTEFVRVARISELQEGLVRVFNVEGLDVAVVKHEGRFYAFEGRCPHAGYSFNYTRVKPGDRIICSSHFAIFELATGRLLAGPLEEGLKLYEVKVEEDEVLVCTETKE